MTLKRPKKRCLNDSKTELGRHSGDIKSVFRCVFKDQVNKEQRKTQFPPVFTVIDCIVFPLLSMHNRLKQCYQSNEVGHNNIMSIFTSRAAQFERDEGENNDNDNDHLSEFDMPTKAHPQFQTGSSLVQENNNPIGFGRTIEDAFLNSNSDKTANLIGGDNTSRQMISQQLESTMNYNNKFNELNILSPCYSNSKLQSSRFFQRNEDDYFTENPTISFAQQKDHDDFHSENQAQNQIQATKQQENPSLYSKKQSNVIDQSEKKQFPSSQSSSSSSQSGSPSSKSNRASANLRESQKKLARASTFSQEKYQKKENPTSNKDLNLLTRGSDFVQQQQQNSSPVNIVPPLIGLFQPVDHANKRGSKIVLNNADWREKLGGGGYIKKDESDGHKKQQAVPSSIRGLFVQKTGNGFSLDVFNAMRRMKGYAQKMVSKVESKRYQLIKQQKFEFLRDKSISDLSERESTSISGDFGPLQAYLYSLLSSFLSWTCVRIISEYTNRLQLFQPQSKKKFLWDILHTMVTIAFFFIIPLHDIYGVEFQEIFLFDYGDIIACIILTFDIFICMNTAKFSKGNLLRNRSQILIEYFSREGLIDLAAVVCAWIIVLEDREGFKPQFNRNIGYLFFFSIIVKILTLSSILNKINDRFYLGKTNRGIIELIQIIFNLFIVSHLFACAWLMIGKWRQQSTQYDYEDCKANQADNNNSLCLFTWLDKFRNQNLSIYEEYLRGYYFVTITMITVGYGDIIPINSLEYLLSILTMLIACGMFGYSLNSIGQILAEINKDHKTYSEHFCAINGYMHKKNISRDLQFQVKEYLQYYFIKSNVEDNEMSQKVLKIMPETLQNQIVFEANKIILEKSNIFKDNFSLSILEKTIGLVEQRRLRPGEEVFDSKAHHECAIYFIEKGRVDIVNRSNRDTIKTLEAGESFGEIAFFTDQQRNMSIRSLEFTTLLRIKRKSFLELISSSPIDFEKFSMIKDSILFQNQLDLIGISCFCCKSTTHSIVDCNYIHQVPDQFKVINSYVRQQNQVREFIKRSGSRLNSLDNIGPITACSILFVEDNIEFLQTEMWFTDLVQKEMQSVMLGHIPSSNINIQNPNGVRRNTLTLNEIAADFTPRHRQTPEFHSNIHAIQPHFQRNPSINNFSQALAHHSVMNHVNYNTAGEEDTKEFAPHLNFTSAFNDPQSVPSQQSHSQISPQQVQQQMPQHFSGQLLKIYSLRSEEGISYQVINNQQLAGSSSLNQRAQQLNNMTSKKTDEETKYVGDGLEFSGLLPQINQSQLQQQVHHSGQGQGQSSHFGGVRQVSLDTPHSASKHDSPDLGSSVVTLVSPMPIIIEQQIHRQNSDFRIPSQSVQHLQPSTAPQLPQNLPQIRKGAFSKQFACYSSQCIGTPKVESHLKQPISAGLRNSQQIQLPSHQVIRGQRKVTLKSDYTKLTQQIKTAPVSKHAPSIDRQNEHLMQQIQDLIMIPNSKTKSMEEVFETMKQFSIYFPNHNFENVLKKFRIFMAKKSSSSSKKKLVSYKTNQAFSTITIHKPKQHTSLLNATDLAQFTQN